MTEPIDWEEEEDRIAPRFLAADDPTGWFEELYAGGESGRITMPFSRTEPHPLLTEWAGRRLAGAGGRAVIVGCGLGADAEYIAGRSFRTTAFDISEAAVRIAQRRHEGSPVDYVVGNLLDPPREWLGAFDLVVEIFTVQALPDPPRRQAIRNVSRLVAAEGTLIVIASIHGDSKTGEPPPWPLTRAEIDAFATGGLTPVAIDIAELPGGVDQRRWRAEFQR